MVDLMRYRLAEVKILAPISVIIPTYREAANIPELLRRLDSVRSEQGIDLDVFIMDDNSGDGIEEIIAKEKKDWVHLVVRTANKGLSAAVLDGLRRAKNTILVVMDADLSHPPERIPDMVLALEAGQEFVIGSRYVAGARTDEDWGFFRWLNSRIATLLARPFSKAKDPMSGFFALRRADFLRAADLNPIGYKIGLELIVKCRLENIGEVPIYFADRKYGESKLNLKEQIRYVIHLRRLFIYKFGTWSRILQFLAVGLIGAFINLAVLTVMSRAGMANDWAIATGIVVSVVTNFILNRRFTFSYARQESLLAQFFGFCIASSLGAFVNFSVASLVLKYMARAPLQLAAGIGIFSGMFLNFFANRYIVFRERRIKGGGGAP